MTERDTNTDKVYNENGYYQGGLANVDQLKRFCREQPRGMLIETGTLPPGVLVVKNFLDANTCQTILAYAEARKGASSTVQNPYADAADRNLLSRTRNSELIDIEGIADRVLPILANVLTRNVAPHFGAQLEWFEYPQLLRYREGGEYTVHADSENWIAERRRWERGMDRDYSLLIYLNEEFSGGEIEFANFGFQIRPRRGMLLAFPSDHRYVHAARPVTAGNRYVLVTWSAAKGSPRVNMEPPPRALRLDGM